MVFAISTIILLRLRRLYLACTCTDNITVVIILIHYLCIESYYPYYGHYNNLKYWGKAVCFVGRPPFSLRVHCSGGNNTFGSLLVPLISSSWIILRACRHLFASYFHHSMHVRSHSPLFCQPSFLTCILYIKQMHKIWSRYFRISPKYYDNY